MGLIRKKTLKQFLDLYDEYKKVVKIDITDETTKDYPQHIDPKSQRDLDYDDAYDQSNELIGTYGMGNFGEMYGDITNHGKYSNLLFSHNPLEMTDIDSYENFGLLHGFGEWFVHRHPDKVQKFDIPDNKLLENYKPTENKSLNHLKTFEEFSKE